LTVQNVQNSLKAFLKICARKPGIEKSLAVRGHIQGIRYSPKRVCVDFRVGRSSVGDCENGAVPSDSRLSVPPPASPSAPKSKGPDRVVRSSPLPPFGGFVNGGVYEGPPNVIPLTFPNLSHSYWENYSLTGEYHVKRLEAAHRQRGI
jgi:hypothetical protein